MCVSVCWGITVLCVVTLRRRTFLIPGARSGNAVNARESVVVAFFLFCRIMSFFLGQVIKVGIARLFNLFCNFFVLEKLMGYINVWIVKIREYARDCFSFIILNHLIGLTIFLSEIVDIMSIFEQWRIYKRFLIIITLKFLKCLIKLISLLNSFGSGKIKLY